MKFFKHCFVLNLSERTDRMEQVAKDLGELGIQFERIESIRPFNRTHRLKAPKYGCLLSHHLAIKIAKQRGYESVMLLEDDVLFSPDFTERSRNILPLLDAVPWDIFHFGPRILDNPMPHGELLRLTHFTLGHAYAVHSRCYDHYLARMNKWSGKPHDGILASFCRNRIVLAPKEPLVWQRAGFSDLSQAYREWQWGK